MSKSSGERERWVHESFVLLPMTIQGERDKHDAVAFNQVIRDNVLLSIWTESCWSRCLTRTHKHERRMIAAFPSTMDCPSKPATRFHVKLIVYGLVALFGLGTWTNLSGLWIELPLIVPFSPESWELPAKLALIINAANVFPIVLVFVSLIFKLNTAPFEVTVNFVFLCTSISFAIGFALFWDGTASLFGTQQSLYLMLLCFFTAIIDSTSSITFIPFLHRYDPMYLNAYFVGEALTGLLPALFGFAQGIGVTDCVLTSNYSNASYTEFHHEPRFSVRTYYLALSSLPFSALIAFSFLRVMKTGRLDKPVSTGKAADARSSRIFILMNDITDVQTIEHTLQSIDRIEDRLQAAKKRPSLPMTTRLKQFALSEAGIFLCVVFQGSATLYGICPGLTTYSLNAYSLTTFHYTIIASKSTRLR